MNESSYAARLLHAVWIGVTETLIWLPIPLMLAVWLLPEPAWYGWLALHPLLYAAGERISARFVRMRRLYRFAICAAAGTLAAYAVFGSSIAAALAAVINAVFFYRGMTSIGPEDMRQVREVLLPALIVYFFVSIASGFIDQFDGFRLWLTIGGVFTLLLTIRRSNRIALAEANLSSGRGVPRSVIARNRIMIGAFAMTAAVVVLFRQLEALWRAFVRWMNGVLSGIGSGEQTALPEEETPPMPLQEEMFPPVEGEPSLIWVILDYVVMAFGIVVVAILLWMGLRSLRRIPLLAKLFAKWLAAWRERKPSTATGGYEDEVESISGASPLSAVMKRLRSLVVRGESWSSMSPEEQIRYLFRRRFKAAMKQGYAYRPELTPHENMDAMHASAARPADGDSQLAEAYAGVRYGGRAAAKEEAAGLKSQLDL